MNESSIKQTLWFLALVLVQVLVFNHIHVAGYATPFIYIYFLLMLNLDTKRNTLLLAGFLLGLVIDMFANTPGMNAAATTLLEFLRPWLISHIVPRDNTDDRR
uniref:rod shape-determining protein MreD n=1 Tax=Phocaeicola sp. TaxID=2773926 RepID=UPI003FED4358